MQFRRSAFGACATAAIAALALSTAANGATRAGSSSPSALAGAINVTLKDAPRAINWTSTKATPESVTAYVVGKTAVACMRKSHGKAGKVGPDPFGTLGKTGGVAEADVTSPTIAEAGASTGVPSFDSEVVVVSTSAQADADLAALSTTSDMSCLATAIQSLYSIDVASQTDIAWAFKKLTRYGSGVGGVHAQFVLTASTSSTPLVEDEYFYVVGRAEISLQFFNLNNAFDATWAASIIDSVISRAKSILDA